GTDEVSEKATSEKHQTRKLYQNKRERTKPLLKIPFQVLWLHLSRKKGGKSQTLTNFINQLSKN
ncbi:MAG: hypothetical protein IKA68_02850, partial [Clostridia bacterium]|nr:hypothetical protein [Clostridia bacterium]